MYLPPSLPLAPARLFQATKLVLNEWKRAMFLFFGAFSF